MQVYYLRKFHDTELWGRNDPISQVVSVAPSRHISTLIPLPPPSSGPSPVSVVLIFFFFFEMESHSVAQAGVQ